MQIIRIGAAILAAISLTAPALAETVTCESVNGRERFCPANTRGGVHLSSQFSREGCYQGDTWGYDRGGIWVSGGCRAQFQTGYSGSNWHGDNNYYHGDGRHESNDGAKGQLRSAQSLGRRRLQRRPARTSPVPVRLTISRTGTRAAMQVGRTGHAG